MITAPTQPRRLADEAGCRVDIRTTEGAPSPTAVFAVDELPDAATCSTRVRAVYPSLRRLAGPVTKVLFVAPTGPGQVVCRFVQLPAGGPGTTGPIEVGRDCINSVVAAYRTALRLTDVAAGPSAQQVTFLNRDTGLRVAARPGSHPDTVTVQARPASAIDPAAAVLPLTGGGPGLLAIRVNNPYLLLDACTAGFTREDLLSLHGAPTADVLGRLASAAGQIRARLGLPAGSDLPKTALLCRDRDGLVARSIYLGRWHPGLPLTGVISFLTAVLLPASPWARPTSCRAGRIRIRGPHGCVDVCAAREPGTGMITAYRVADRRVSTHVENATV